MVRAGGTQLRCARRIAMAGWLLCLNACGVSDNINNFLFGGQVAPGTQRVKGFIGAVIADEPNAALIGREVLATGGNAADAAVAVAFALTVTYPSRAGLGGGGACLAYRPSVDKSSTGYTPLLSGAGQGTPDAVLFVPPAPASAGSATRPAAVPMMPRGLFVLGARYGSRTFESLIGPAEQLARFGAPVSRAFGRDLATVGTALLADPGAKSSFGPSGTPLAEGAKMLQPELSALLAQLRVEGVGSFYQGGMSRQLATAAANVGGGLTAEDFRTALPKVLSPLVVRAGSDQVAFLPPPADGGLAAAAAFQLLQSGKGDLTQAADLSAAVVARWRSQGGDPQALLEGPPPPPATLPALPASTSFVTFDNKGAAVACALTMNNLFGTGRVATGTGMLLAASPASVPPPLLAAAIAWNQNLHVFRAASAGSGQDAAGLAVAASMNEMLQKAAVSPVPEPGRVNIADCPEYLPGNAESCRWATDPRGAGVALSGD
jgi:gamma-glutamyltranspeptidase/glutathione hydrolase